MIWLANALLLLAYILLGKRMFRAGWLASLVGNLLWWYPTSHSHQWAFFCLSVVFAFVAGYNLFKATRYADANQPGPGTA